MRLLALETATVEVGVALVADGELLATATVRPGRRHAETLHPAVEAVCALAGVGLGELDAVAVDAGPGLFTGLRVGVAAAQGFALALGLPALSCTSLEVLHHAAREVAGPVAAVVDMRRGELAWSIRPARTPGGGAAPFGPVDLSSPEVLAGRLAEAESPVLLVGDGARRHGEHLAGLVVAAGGPPPVVCGPELGAPPVASLALLAAERLAGGAGGDPGLLEPVYLRPVDARINWTTRDGPAVSGALPAGAG